MGTMMTMSVTGFVGGEVTVRQVGEQRVASFSVAVSRKNRAGEKQTLWVRVNCWNRLADIAQQYVKRGSLIQATSEWLRPSAWVDQSGTPQPSLDMDANRLVLLDRAENGDHGHSEPEEQIPF
ncbi:MAG: single-stranded DNA-binding protein [Anaerolineae bacterium]|nr:single-stranded DNA-binding protein [Anaerolineae bacterium]